MLWKPETIDLIPDPQTWLTTWAGLSFEIPDSISACLAGFWPAPPVKTCPKIISSISFYLILAFFIESRVTLAPNLNAGIFFKLLFSEPTAVLVAEVIKTFFIVNFICYFSF